jgi:hypothetical protein
MYLRKASEVMPHDERPWLDQGLMAEVDNNLNEVDRNFHEAARLDLRTPAAWALVNFDFRHKRP